MSVYSDVQEFEEKLGAFIVSDPPSVHWAQLGQLTMTCTSYAVGTTGVREEPLFPAPGLECQMLEIADLIAAIARECSFEGNEDGTTDPAKVEAISMQQDEDLTALRAWSEALPKPPQTPDFIQFVSEGGLAVTTLSTSAYVGWT